jgi:hypothetical protein
MIFPFVALIVLAILILYIRRLRDTNLQRRTRLLNGLGIQTQDTKRIVGFFHPYW